MRYFQLSNKKIEVEIDYPEPLRLENVTGGRVSVGPNLNVDFNLVATFKSPEQIIALDFSTQQIESGDHLLTITIEDPAHIDGQYLVAPEHKVFLVVP